MRRPTKASSAGSTQRQASRLALLLSVTAALLLLPAALAVAAPPNGSMKVLIEGAGSGEVKSIGEEGELETWPGSPPIACTYASPGPATGVCEDEMSDEEGSYGVLMIATPAPGSKFSGWVIEGAEFKASGCDNPAAGTCLPLNLGAETEVTARATFVLAPPVVTNDAPGTVTQTSVVMKGHVNNEGAEAGSSCKFVIEKEATPGVIAEPACDVNPVTGSTDTAVQATASSLEANTKYVYRVVATSSAGTSTAAPDQSAQTLPNAPVVTNDAPGTVTQTSVVMKGHVNNEGAEAGSACKFVIALQSAPGTPIAEPACDVTPVTGSTSTAVEATASGLSANSKYVYRVIATNTGGTSTGTPDQATQTLPNAPAITNDAPGTVIQTSVVMKGHVNNEGAEAGSACKFVIALQSAPGTPIAEPACSLTPVTGSASTAVEATASGLTANSKYLYRVIATNSGGTTTGAPDQKLSTLVNPPSVISGAGATGLTQSTATLAGTVNPNAGTLSACRVEYGTSASYGSQAPCASLPAPGSSPAPVSASLAGLVANTTYHFRFAATNAGGSANGADQTFTTLANTCATDPALCPPAAKPGVAKAASAASVSANKAALKLSCSGGACSGSLKLTAKLKQGKKTKTLTIAKGSFSLVDGAAKTLTVTITNGAAKQELNKGKTLKAKLSGSGIEPSTVKLKPAKKKH